MTEIPIKDVTYEDFCLMLGTIYPRTIFPNDETSEKLLEMADRFLIPAVTNIVEQQLLYNSQMQNEKLIRLADQYQMKMLLNKSTWKVDSLEKVKELIKTLEYEKL
ncbi:BTB domain-containing protein [Caenorhabditis elegans]|uniref:BTB domain-containing protein n=1 Tax=Caenorhabditis elegans TaxID=6239 RepID=Q9N5P7_CAEEL|nr:BTB domain-containing protein [Caenorhabditis elegans]CCD61291.2 BTB domain-containing protein [Caenorhabditis elegans]|eukprot:NP_494159.3 BTB (Broad/complex/Tramtrack/Bric a brac) domain protein [Caenorhabditis elegans]